MLVNAGEEVRSGSSSDTAQKYMTMLHKKKSGHDVYTIGGCGCENEKGMSSSLDRTTDNNSRHGKTARELGSRPRRGQVENGSFKGSHGFQCRGRRFVRDKVARQSVDAEKLHLKSEVRIGRNYRWETSRTVSL